MMAVVNRRDESIKLPVNLMLWEVRGLVAVARIGSCGKSSVLVAVAHRLNKTHK